MTSKSPTGRPPSASKKRPTADTVRPYFLYCSLSLQESRAHVALLAPSPCRRPRSSRRLASPSSGASLPPSSPPSPRLDPDARPCSSDSSAEEDTAPKRLPKTAKAAVAAAAEPSPPKVTPQQPASTLDDKPTPPTSSTSAPRTVDGAAPTPLRPDPHAPAKLAATTSTPSTDFRPSPELGVAQPQPRKSLGAFQGPYATINALRAISIKKTTGGTAPSPPALSPDASSPVDGPAPGSRVRFASKPEGPSTASSSSQIQPAPSALRQGPVQAAPRAPTPQPVVAAPPTAPSPVAAEQAAPAPPPPPAATAAEPRVASPSSVGAPAEEGVAVEDPLAAAKEAEAAKADLVRRLGEMEARLRKSAWCVADSRFEREALPVACAEAIPIDAPLVRRLKRCVSLSRRRTSVESPR